MALKHTENALTSANNDVVAVLAPNDSTAGAVVQALTAQNLQGKVGVSGQDGDIAACQRIVEGTQTGTAFKYLPALSTTAFEAACNIAMDRTDIVDEKATALTDNGAGDVPTIWVPVIWVNKDNIDETIAFHRQKAERGWSYLYIYIS